MTNIIETYLKNQGFNDNDWRIYLDIYRHGRSFASSVAVRTGIDRTTVYSSLKRLLKKGVIAQTKVNDIYAYVPVSPEIFIEEVEGRIADLKAEKSMAQLFVEELKTLQKSSLLKPRIKIFEGPQAIVSLFEETLQVPGEQKAFITICNLPPIVKNFFKHKYTQSKRKKNVFSRVIVKKSSFSDKYKSMDKQSNRETRIVEDHPFDLHAEIVLFDQSKVAIVDFHEQMYGLLVDSQTLYKSVEAMFDYIWGSLE